MRVAAALLALIAVVSMCLAIAGMVTGRQSDRLGWVLRATAVACFGAAVALNAAAH